MTLILGASRKQAGLYYDKGGAIANVMHPDFSNGLPINDGVTDASAAVQAAHDFVGAGGTLIFPPGGTYVVDALTISNTAMTLLAPGGPRSARLRFINPTGTLFTVTGTLPRFQGFELESPGVTHTAGTVFDIRAGQGKVSDIRVNGNFWNVHTLETDGVGGWGFDWVRVVGGLSLNSLFRFKGVANTIADDHITNIFAATNTNYSDAAVVVDTFVDTLRIMGGTLGGNGKIIHVRDTGASQKPRYVFVTGVFMEGAAGTGDGVIIDEGDEIEFTACHMGLCRYAYTVNGGRDISFNGGNVLSIPRSAFKLNGGTRVSINGPKIRDCSKETTLTYPSIDIGAGVSEWSVEGVVARLRAGTLTKPPQQLRIAAGASDKFRIGRNDWGVSGTDYGNAGDSAVSDGSTGTNVVLADSIPTALHRGGTTVSVTGTLVETTLKTVTVPGGALKTRDGIRVIAGGTCSGVAGTKTLKLKFGASILATIVVPLANTDSWLIIADIFNAGAVNAQVYVSQGSRTPFDTEGSVVRNKSGNFTEDTTTALALALTGTLGNVGDTIVCRSFHMEVLRR